MITVYAIVLCVLTASAVVALCGVAAAQAFFGKRDFHNGILVVALTFMATGALLVLAGVMIMRF